jgi:hypothetical protein
MSVIIKKSLSFMLILTMLFSVFTMNSTANDVENEYEVMPCFTTISAVTTVFSISGINSTSSVVLSSQYSTSLYIKIELQKEKSTGYETIETWTKSGTGTYLGLEETRLINIFADYRIKVTCKADNETHVTYDYP